MVRAEFGPFEASQMVPTQYVVPDLDVSNNSNNNNNPNKSRPTVVTDFKPRSLDLSAHMVNQEVGDGVI